MSYNEMFFAHGPCGFAVMMGKSQIGEWSISGAGDAMERLTCFLAWNDGQDVRDAYYPTQVHDDEDPVEPFLILTSITFRKIWTTPSGLLFCWRDYVDPAATFRYKVETGLWTYDSSPWKEIEAAEIEYGTESPVDLKGIFRIELLDEPLEERS